MSFESAPRIAVFDFDGTLYSKDSLLDFCLYYYKKKPWRIWFLGVQAIYWVGWKLNFINTTRFKARFIGFIQGDSREEVNKLSADFWSHNRRFNGPVIQALKRCQTQGFILVVASASPDVFITPACSALKIQHLVATSLHFSSGSYQMGENCRGSQKLDRVRALFPTGSIEEVYSDNSDDLPLLNAANRGYIIKAGQIIPFNPGDAVH
jgi:HAD superfamily phosphoserine phosphatase-like hydrolase